MAALNHRLKLDLAAAQQATTLEQKRGEAYKDEYYQERSSAAECNQQWLTAVQGEEYWETMPTSTTTGPRPWLRSWRRPPPRLHGLRRDLSAGSDPGGRA